MAMCSTSLKESTWPCVQLVFFLFIIIFLNIIVVIICTFGLQLQCCVYVYIYIYIARNIDEELNFTYWWSNSLINYHQ